jgi:Fe-S-cluster containining protein
MSALRRWITARIAFSLVGQRFDVQASLPQGRARPRDLLPALHAIDDAVVDSAVHEVERQGHTISCRKGCGACCRQVVPISEAEAHQLREVIERLPPPRQATIRTRFAAARERFERAGLLDRLRRPGQMNDEQRQKLALDYFREWVACPFLEDESCSIWPDRPLECREYLVTTPAEHCSRPLEESVVSVGLPGRVSVALGELGTSTSERGVWWLPLILALEWTDAHPLEPKSRPTQQLLREVLGRLTQQHRPAHN